MVNFVSIFGNLGADPKTGTTQKGMPWASASIAVTKIYKDVQTTSWVNIKAWGKTAEILAKLKKGEGLLAVGEIETSQYDNKEGKKIHSTHVLAKMVYSQTQAKAPDQLSSPEAMFDGI